MSEELKTKELFEIEKMNLPGQLSSLIENTTYCWEILPNIKETIKTLVSQTPEEHRIKGSVASGAVLKSKDIIIEEGAIVEDLAYIDGPTYIAKGAVVRHGAYIRGGVYLGEGCIAGHTTEIKDSLLLYQSKAAHFAYLGNSVLGMNVNLGAGTKLANLRLDHKNIVVKYQDEKFDTGLKKFGAIFGDNAQSGCNSVTNPGTILINYSAILPTKNATGVVKNKMGMIRRKKA